MVWWWRYDRNFAADYFRTRWFGSALEFDLDVHEEQLEFQQHGWQYVTLFLLTPNGVRENSHVVLLKTTRLQRAGCYVSPVSSAGARLMI